MQPFDPTAGLHKLNELWRPFSELDFGDSTLVKWSFDTRDWHFRCGKDEDLLKEVDLHKTRKHPAHYFHTQEEVEALINRYYKESGGPGEWRHFSLTGIFRATYGDWQMKYIRVYRFEKGFIVCNAEDFVFNKTDLAARVDQKYLYHH